MSLSVKIYFYYCYLERKIMNCQLFLTFNDPLLVMLVFSISHDTHVTELLSYNRRFENDHWGWGLDNWRFFYLHFYQCFKCLFDYKPISPFFLYYYCFLLCILLFRYTRCKLQFFLCHVENCLKLLLNYLTQKWVF